MATVGRTGVTLSYASVKRYVRSHIAPVTAKVTVRLETPPGQQVQVDFGLTRVRVGERVQSLWVFVMESVNRKKKKGSRALRLADALLKGVSNLP